MFDCRWRIDGVERHGNGRHELIQVMKTIDRIGSAFLRRILLRMKVSRPYITKVLRRDVNFSFRTAAKLANALKMDFFPELRPQDEKVDFSA